MAVIGASQGVFGAAWAQADLRKILQTIGARVEDECFWSRAQRAFTPEGRLRDSKDAAALASILEARLQCTVREAA